METDEKSLAELMNEAFSLSLRVAYATFSPEGYCHEARTCELPDMVWSWADGLMHKHYHDHASGRCSIQASIDFDVAAFEAEVVRDIGTMKALLAELGEPRTLTVAEIEAWRKPVPA